MNFSGWSPYPGLRPFQPDDSEYFYGRDQQVDEIVARLREKRFVAVIGGSGSGKSSLVLAGAIPRLRSFAIKDAGDFWAPVIATPGTNHVGADTPIRRLARKFCGELVAEPDAAAAQARLEACVDTLRQPNGLGALVERFGAQLKSSDGVKLDRSQVKVNFLFLLDQFEELFHPSNTREPVAGDCAHLVDRIVEQFKQPHRQICIAITMRSEHLNDCPRYEALPDAINAASYLVKRLDAGQLAAAIEQPVLRYLRKHVADERAARRMARVQGRAVAPSAPLPEQITIDPALIARLVADSKTVLLQQDHADHLPLLQHLLFWIWHEASERPDNAALVDEITLDDLWHAVGPMPGAPVQPLDASVNTLEACLENRCQAIYNANVDEQPVWEAVFRSLAFKEPNTGTYTQQRAAMPELRARLGITVADEAGANAALAAHLQPWLAPHGYLHWDIDSRTVKVAHETLIRRWKKLREWIDEEDRQFHVYLRLLEDCERWVKAPQPDWALSSGDTLRRYEDAKLQPALQDPAWLARIGRLLAMDRDGERLGAVAADAARFLNQSLQARSDEQARHQRAQERQHLDEAKLAQAKRDNDVFAAENAVLIARADAEHANSLARAAASREKARRTRGWYVLGAFVLLYPIVWYWALARAERLLAEKERTLHRSYALASESLAGFQPQFKDLDGPQGLLRYAMVGAQFFNAGRQKPTGPAGGMLRRYYEERLDALGNTERFSESSNTNSLRGIVLGAVWPVVASASAPAAPMVLRPGEPCRTVRVSAAEEALPGKSATFFARSGAREREGLLLVESSADAAAPSAVKSISIGQRDADGQCLVGQQLLATPQQQAARVGIAGGAANIVIGFDGYTQFYSVAWDDPNGVSTRPRATVTTRAEFAEGALPTRQSRFWTDVALGDVAVRLFDIEPSLIAGAEFGGEGRALLRLPVDAGGAMSPCRSFVKAHNIDLTAEQVWEPAPQPPLTAGSHSHCLRVSPKENSAGNTFYLASLYAVGETTVSADRDRDLPLIQELPLGDRRPTEMRLVEHKGWLAFRSGGEPWRAAPWGLTAYGEMARAVFKPAGADAGKPLAKGCGREGEEPQFHLPFNLIMGEEHCPTDAELMQATAPTTAALARP